jgi:hypothetical protein
MAGLIPKEHWSVPSWIDMDKANEEMQKLMGKGVVYGDSLSYRHMVRMLLSHGFVPVAGVFIYLPLHQCRYNSGSV